MGNEAQRHSKVLWIPQIVAAVVLALAGSGKLLGGATDIFIFEQLGQEPIGRYIAGITEWGAAILLMMPRWSALGSLGAVGTMMGAATAHATVLGFEVNGDGGLHVALLLLVLLCAGVVLLVQRRNLPIVGQWL